MKQKKIASKLTKAKKQLGKITEKVTRLESRLEKVKKGDAGPQKAVASPVPAEKSEIRTKLSVVGKPKPAARTKAVTATSRTRSKKSAG